MENFSGVFGVMHLAQQQLRRAGLAAAGVLTAEQALRHLREGAAPPAPFRSLLVAVFPYFAGAERGNLSLYARGMDYHRVARARLLSAARQLGLEGAVLVDAPPFCEVALAAEAGLGNVGRNRLLVSREFGSFCFIGTLAAQQELAPLQGGLAPGCSGCGACLAACPTGALSAGGLEERRCLSAITQLRRLEGEQQALLTQSALVWGCDLCQLCCPANRGIPLATEPAFRRQLIHSLHEDQLAQLSNRAFLRQYGDRAFSWRGIAPLRRNISILERQPE